MKSLEEIRAIYKKECEKAGRYYEVDQEIKNSLRKDYINALPMNKQLAIYLHSKLCHENHSDMCSFNYGIRGIEDDWTEYAHERYLKKANNLLNNIKKYLNVSNDIEALNVIKSVIDII